MSDIKTQFQRRWPLCIVDYYPVLVQGSNAPSDIIDKLIKAVLLGDLLQKMLTKNRAYEINKGETKALFDKWMKKGKELIIKSSNREFKKAIYNIVEDFEKIELDKKGLK